MLIRVTDYQTTVVSYDVIAESIEAWNEGEFEYCGDMDYGDCIDSQEIDCEIIDENINTVEEYFNDDNKYRR